MEKYLQILKSVDLFEGIEEADLQSLLSCLSAKIVHYDKKQYVFMNGDSAENVGIVLSGQALVFKEDYYGNRNIIGKINEGMLFGAIFACADIKELSVSVFTETKSEILLIDFRRLITMCTKACHFHNKLINNMLRIIAVKTINLSQKIEFTSKRTTREKLLAYLYAEAQKNKSKKFSIPFNRQELADFLYVDRSAMSAELCKLRDGGVLVFNKNRFELL